MNPNTGEIRRFPSEAEAKMAGFTEPVTPKSFMRMQDEAFPPRDVSFAAFCGQMDDEARSRGLRRPLTTIDYDKLSTLNRRQRRDYFDERRAVERKLITHRPARFKRRKKVSR